MCHIAEMQYAKIFACKSPDISSPDIQTRIPKAAAVSLKRWGFHLVVQQNKVEIENKAVKKQFDDRYWCLFQGYRTKKTAFHTCGRQ